MIQYDTLAWILSENPNQEQVNRTVKERNTGDLKKLINAVYRLKFQEDKQGAKKVINMVYKEILNEK